MDEEMYDDYDEYEDEEVGLGLALQQQMGQAPWYVSSVAVHCIIFLFMLLIPVTPREDKNKRIIITTEMIEEDEMPEEEPIPDIKENKEEIITETEVTVPEPVVVTQDVEIAENFETAEEMDNDNAKGDPENMSDLDSDFVGTPALMGIGANGGSGGGGRFGFRDGGGRRNKVRIGGGSKKTESSVNMALKWLAAHQESDGRWDCKKYGGGHHGGDDVAVTSMSLLAFLGAGNSTRFGKYKRNVRAGVEWLIQQQGENGCIGQHRYTGGLSTMAIAEAFGMSQGSELREAAQKAVDWAVKSQNTNGSWDYGPNSARSDLSVAGWWIMGLKSAKVAGLDVPTDTMDKALAFVDSWTTDTGKAGYTQAGSGSIRMTAVSLTCQQFLGHDRKHPKVVACAKATINNLPNGQNPDFYLTYYQALGLFQTGIKGEYWKAFNDPMKTSLLTTQVTAGTYQENKGSWNHDGDKYGGSWGRCGQTALGALMLEVYYRYAEVKH
jgi:hypothetical protein